MLSNEVSNSIPPLQSAVSLLRTASNYQTVPFVPLQEQNEAQSWCQFIPPCPVPRNSLFDGRCLVWCFLWWRVADGRGRAGREGPGPYPVRIVAIAVDKDADDQFGGTTPRWLRVEYALSPGGAHTPRSLPPANCTGTRGGGRGVGGAGGPLHHTDRGGRTGGCGGGGAGGNPVPVRTGRAGGAAPPRGPLRAPVLRGPRLPGPSSAYMGQMAHVPLSVLESVNNPPIQTQTKLLVPGMRFYVWHHESEGFFEFFLRRSEGKHRNFGWNEKDERTPAPPPDSPFLPSEARIF